MMMNYLFLIICILLSVGYLTLLERKVLSYIQERKGPNKTSMMGIFQPLSDGVKLFTKENNFPMMANKFLFIISPIMNIFVSMMLWMIYPFFSHMLNFNLGILFILCCSSVIVYTVMISGWSSNSIYSFIGSMRSVAQVISYEVNMALIFISFFFLLSSLNIFNFMIYQKFVYLFILSFPLSMLLFISMLAETNRSPFDLAEGESELVSGFNIEYSGGGFAIIFMAEYMNIIFMSMLYSFFLLGGLNFLFLKVIFMSFVFIWIRGTLPRMRYDKFMELSWKYFLISSLSLMMFFFSLKLFLEILIL
uniref:NADH-ubiquinone oxidoreductase chain 1 n=1 Tax=Cerophytidae sp. BMNH 900085 TaxID=1903808 RepID=A0A343A4J5_9COLE|nr:NADH dehydrogenase subunit 1 [Cerophytidae sp. BMNH 900085]